MIEGVTYQIRVIKASNPSYWYADNVGDTFPILREVQEGYMTREPAGYLNIIYKQDAEVIKEKE